MHHLLNEIGWRWTILAQDRMLKQELRDWSGACDMSRWCERKMGKKGGGNIEQLRNGLGEKQRQNPDEENGQRGNAEYGR